MFILLFLTFVILGVILLLVTILFFHHNRNISRNTLETAPPVSEPMEDYRFEEYRQMPEHERSFEAENHYEGTVSGNGNGNAYIPVIDAGKAIPGVNKQEIIHFLSSGTLFNLETLTDPQKIVLNEHDLIPEIEGNIVLTTRTIVIFNEKNVRKILIDSIGMFHFQSSYLIIKRKNVKKKKDVLKISGNLPEFRYIFNVLT